MWRYLRRWIFLSGLGASLTAGPASAATEWKYPSPAAFWAPVQYADFEEVYCQTHLALPYLRKPESRVLFERLVDRGNIERILAEPASREDRQRKLRMILAAMGAIRADYNVSVAAGEPLQEELTRVQAFNLYVTGAVVGLAEADFPETSYASAIKTGFLGVVQSLSERQTYSGAQIAALGDALARRYPEVSELFNDRERGLLRNQIAELESQAPETETRAALHRLLATISAE